MWECASTWLNVNRDCLQVYSTFDWSQWRVVGAYAALPVCSFVAFLIYAGVARLRESLGRRWQASGCCGQPTKQSQNDIQLTVLQSPLQQPPAGSTPAVQPVQHDPTRTTGPHLV